jgi:hypothetical protein
MTVVVTGAVVQTTVTASVRYRMLYMAQFVSVQWTNHFRAALADQVLRRCCLRGVWSQAEKRHFVI